MAAQLSLGEMATVISGGGELAKILLEVLSSERHPMKLKRLAKKVSEKGFGSAKNFGSSMIREALKHANHRQMRNGRPPLFIESRPNTWGIAMASDVRLAKSYLSLDRWQGNHHEVLKNALIKQLDALDANALCTVVTLLIERMNYSEITSYTAIGNEVSTLAGFAPRGLANARVAVRLANPSRKLTREDIMAFRGSLHIFDASEGVVIAVGGIEKEAYKEGIIPNLSQISLMNKNDLAEMMIVSEIGVSRFQVEVSYLDEGFFRE